MQFLNRCLAPLPKIVPGTLATIFVLMSLSACTEIAGGGESSGTVNPFPSFKDVPGITAEEIAAIEALQREYESFSFGAPSNTETFIKEDGGVGGFTALFCVYLSDLFGIPFLPEIGAFNILISRHTNGNLNFMGSLAVTPERLQLYKMSDPIAERQIKMMRIWGSSSLDQIAKERLPRFTVTSTGAIKNIVISALQPGTYEIIDVNNIEEAYQSLLSGIADAHIEASSVVDAYPAPDVYTELFYPLYFLPVSLSTGDKVLEPVILVINKALQNGARDYINYLYSLGFEDYKINRFRSQLTPEETSYLHRTTPVPLAAQYFNYPVSFYNNFDKEWQGIAFDILAEVEKFTGLKFQVVNKTDTELLPLLDMLYAGTAHILPDLAYSAALEHRFLWSTNDFLTNQYALLSKTDTPNIILTNITNARVGLIANTSPAEMFRLWFPDAPNTVEYSTDASAFAALDRGEVDFIMASQNRLLSALNYYELPNYKVNFLFNHSETSFAFNRNQDTLRSIIDRIIPLIDTVTITEQWMSKTYDYRRNVAEGRIRWVYGAVILSLAVLALIVVLFFRSRVERKRLVQKQEELVLKQAEVEAATHAKSAFLANMSHELRTPMNSIIGFSDLAMNDRLDGETKDYLNKIQLNSEWLLQIINDILDISKIESGKMELEHITFDLHEMFIACQTMITPKADEKGVNLYFYAEPSIGKKLNGDPVRLRQVILNMLSNAVKFTSKGGLIKVSATVTGTADGALNGLNGARHQSANGCQAPNREKVPGTAAGTASRPAADTATDTVTIHFEVKDSGIGMNAEQLAKISQPFMQADTATTRKYGGTGLGLAISKNIIEMMGGKLKIESAPGVGSKFSFDITFDTTELAEAAAEMSFTDGPVEKPFFSGEILCCEDNQMNQQVLAEHLERVGIKADIAENGREGYNMVKRRLNKGEKPYDLIFMDIHMPVMDGIEASTLINELDTGTPIVAMTANVMSHDRELYQKSGMKDSIGKPFRVQELWACLLKYLEPVKWDAQDEAEDRQQNDKLKLSLMATFVRDNKMRCEEISAALESGDIKLAHRIAHTLKSNAGNLGKTKLQKAAENVEYLLKDGKNLVAAEHLSTLEDELAAVLGELVPLVKEAAPPPPIQTEPLDAEKTQELFAELKPLLERGNSESLKYIDKLRGIAGTGEPLVRKLIQQMEDLDFEDATETLSEIMKNYE